MEKAPKDTVFATPRDDIGTFRFDGEVADVFPDMIARSVPGYEFFLSLLGLTAADYAQAGTRIYDLGCSLGASTLSIRQNITVSDCHITAIDNSPSMIERCRGNITRDNSATPVDVVLSDLEDVAIDSASLVAMNFTLQFIALAQRDALLARLAAGLVPGGALFLAEKIRFDDASEQAYMTRVHESFKRSNGYSALEIAQKRTALEEVMVPEDAATHEARLRAAGFDEVRILARCINFIAILATRAP
jgi:tRNA (cmo5U34)-methyltransferase